MTRILDDWLAFLLAVLLVINVTAIVVVVILRGNDALAGTGLGGLVAVLATALVARVKTNGKGG